jgi:hypothetical protein
VKFRKTYGVGAGADAEPPLVLSSVRDMSPKRFLMSGKKSSLGKTSSSWASVMKNSPVVAQSAPQKTYRLSPVQDRKRRGSGGLLSRLAVHAARQDGEDCEAAKSFGGSRQWWLCAAYSQRGATSLL